MSDSPAIAASRAGGATFAGLLGVAAAVIYVGAVIVGGWLTPGYSHVAHAMSELTTAGAPYRDILNLIFVTYNLLLIAFAVAIPTALGEPRRGIIVGAALLGLVGIAGFGMSTLFPTDRPGDPITTIGWIHIGLAAAASFGSMGAILAFALAFRRNDAWRRFATGSFASLAGIFVSGIWAATTAAQLSPIMGFAERITIGIFILWLFAFSLRILFGRS